MPTKTDDKDSFTIVLIWTVRVAWLASMLIMLIVATDSFTQIPLSSQYLFIWLCLIAGTIGMHQLIKMLSGLET